MMSFLPYMVHYCADLLWSVKRGGAARDWKGRQILRSKASEQNYAPHRGKCIRDREEIREEKGKEEKICIKCQMGLTLDFLN